MISRSMSTAALAAITLAALRVYPLNQTRSCSKYKRSRSPTPNGRSPENLAAINSTFNEQAPSRSPDGLSLYFGSTGPAPVARPDTDLWCHTEVVVSVPGNHPRTWGRRDSSVGDNARRSPSTGTSSSSRVLDWLGPQRHLCVAPRKPQGDFRGARRCC